MKKFPTLLCAIALLHACGVAAQEPKPSDTGKLSPAVEEAEKKSADAKPAEKRGPTEITATKEASFNAKQRTAVFLGNVQIDDPEFKLNAEKLTVYMKKQTPSSDPKAKAGANPVMEKTGGGGLEKAVAEGNVVIEKMQPDGNGGQPVRYTGKAARVEYNAATGDAILSGWPRVQQGINMHVATEQSTVMYLNREGRMRTEGGSRTTIVDPGPGNPLEQK